MTTPHLNSQPPRCSLVHVQDVHSWADDTKDGRQMWLLLLSASDPHHHEIYCCHYACGSDALEAGESSFPGNWLHHTASMNIQIHNAFVSINKVTCTVSWEEALHCFQIEAFSLTDWADLCAGIIPVVQLNQFSYRFAFGLSNINKRGSGECFRG